MRPFRPLSLNVDDRPLRSPSAVSSRAGVAVPGWAAMPIETQRRGVVAELATADFEDSPSEVLHRLTGMHVNAGGQDGADVHERGVALQHPVGDEDQPVA